MFGVGVHRPQWVNNAPPPLKKTKKTQNNFLLIYGKLQSLSLLDVIPQLQQFCRLVVNVEYLMELHPICMAVSKGTTQVRCQLGSFNCLVKGFHRSHYVHLKDNDKGLVRKEGNGSLISWKLFLFLTCSPGCFSGRGQVSLSISINILCTAWRACSCSR